MVVVVKSLADLQPLNQGGDKLKVKVPSVSSIRDSFEIYSIIKEPVDSGVWQCNDLGSLQKLSAVAIELIRIEQKLIPDLISNCEDAEALLLLNNAGDMVADLAGKIPTSKSVCGQIKNVGKAVSTAVTKVEEGQMTTSWLVGFLPELKGKVTKLLDQVSVTFMTKVRKGTQTVENYQQPSPNSGQLLEEADQETEERGVNVEQQANTEPELHDQKEHNQKIEGEGHLAEKSETAPWKKNPEGLLNELNLEMGAEALKDAALHFHLQEAHQDAAAGGGSVE